MVYKTFDEKTGPGASENEGLPHEWKNPMKKRKKEEKSMLGLKIILGSRFSWNWIIIC